MAQQAHPGDVVLEDAPANNRESSIPAQEGYSKNKRQGPRKRVSQACDKCRSRKDKCDGKKPICSTCLTNGRICAYDANVKKRGLPEGYVRGLEKLWGLAIRDVEEVENTLLIALAGDEESSETALGNWNDEANSETLVELWRKSQISRELERLLSSQDLSTEGKRRRLDSSAPAPKANNLRFSTRVNNEDDFTTVMENDWSAAQLDAKRLQEPSPSYSLVDRHQNPVPFPDKEVESILNPKTPSMAHSSNDIDATSNIPDLPSETWHLLDVYFSYTHPWLPIIEKHDLLRISYQYSLTKNSLSSALNGEHALLWATIAYAKFQHRAINNIPRALGEIGEMVWTAERMYAHARSLVPNEEGVLDLGHVQALLILSLANMGMGHQSRAWSLIGQAVRLAIDLGLNQPTDQASKPTKAQSRSKHVFLGCFTLDTLIAARLSRRPHLHASDTESFDSIDEDGLEEWDPWTDCLSVRKNATGGSRVPASIPSTFNRLIQVLKILNEVISLPSGAAAAQNSLILLERLHTWGRSQPVPLNSDYTPTDQAPSLLPHQYHLYNVYYTALAMSQLLSRRQGKDLINLEPCMRSARKVTDLLSQHSNTFGLLIVPPTTEYFLQSVCGIVHEVQKSVENTRITMNDWKRSLDLCLDSLESAWPVFEIFKESDVYLNINEDCRESHINLDYMSMSNPGYESPPGKTPQSLASHDTMSAYSPKVFRAQGHDTNQVFNPAKAAVRPASQRSTSFSQTSSHGLPMNPLNIYESVRGPYYGSDEPQTQPKIVPNPNPFALPAQPLPTNQPPSIPQSQPSFLLPSPSSPLHHRSLTLSSTDLEFDPTFNELLRLDATEWSGNWDQSLMNLGFTDENNTNRERDFYDLCMEPDPLVGESERLFLGLVERSNREVAGGGFERGGGVFGNKNGSVDGFGLTGEDEGIEAGQILQSLSAGDDQRLR